MIYTLWRTHKDGGKRYLMQRLGLYRRAETPSEHTESIWIHAASVGEVFTVLPLLKALNTQLLVTTMSPTGAAVLEQQKLSHVRHQYLPIDFPGACKRFFQQAKIREGWIMETEIWPWLYANARHHQIPLTIINARLSDRTSKRAHGFMGSTFRRALRDVNILARSQDDANRFAELGAEHSAIKVIGNLKYATIDSTDADAPHRSLIDNHYVLAASTHANEEEQLALAWQALQHEKGTTQMLVIVPRHPERGIAIQKQLASHGINAALRSKEQSIGADSHFYIADTLGEMQAWYSSATACFIGGSLIERGGHNVLEAARVNCPIIVGQHTFNFADIITTLEAQEALLTADNAEEVVAWLSRICEDPNAYEPMVTRARDQARVSEGVLNEYIEQLV